MKIDELVAERIAGYPRLKNVPRPIIDAVVEAAFDCVLSADNVADNTEIEELFSSEWARCETCETWIIHPDYDGDGVAICDKCKVQECSAPMD